MEAIADAGEIGISPRLAARLDRRASGRAKEGRSCSLARPRSSASAPPTSATCAAIDIASCIPVAARAHVLLEKSEPEHRTITAAFIDLRTRTRCSSELGTDGLAEALDERMRTIQEAALRYEVPFYESDVGKGSVKALLTAGAPSSTGHDEERMLRALREIMETPGRRADAGRRQHRQGLHRRLRPALPARLPRLRRRDQHRRPGHEQGRAGPDPLDRDRARALADDVRRRRRSSRSPPRARRSRCAPPSSARSRAARVARGGIALRRA